MINSLLPIAVDTQRVRLFSLTVFLTIIAASLVTTDAQAQRRSSPSDGPFLNGVTLGLGLATYHGEMMAEGTFTMNDVLRGGIDAFVGVDKLSEPLVFGLEVGFTRIHTRNNWRSYENHVFRLEGQTGVGIDAGRKDFIRIMSGISLLSHYPRLDYPRDRFEQISGYETKDLSRPTLSAAIPVFLVIDDHLRVGIRWMADDYIDNAAGGGIPDFLLHFGLTHRFDLN